MRARITLMGGMAALVVWACGDEGALTPSDAGVDGDSTADVGSDAWIDGSYGDSGSLGPEHCADGLDNDADGSVDCDDDECTDRLVCRQPQTAEREPNQAREDGQRLALPFLVSGTIGEPTEDEEGNLDDDIDWFQFEIEAPTLIDWSVDDAQGPAFPILSLVGLDDDTRGTARILDGDTPGLSRQAYLPVGGLYGIQVRDRRNSGVGNDEVPYGGDDFVYAFSVSEAELTAESVDLPFRPGVTELGAGNAVAAFDLTIPAGSVLEAEVLAERLAPSSGFDGLLIVINRSDGGVIAIDDDAPLGTYDPLLRTGILSETIDARLIVDAYRVSYTTEYELRVEALDPSRDHEPNEPIALGFPAQPGDDVEGQIAEPFLRFSTLRTDTDYYVYLGGPSAAYSIDVSAAGDEVDLALRTGWMAFNSLGVPFLAEVFQADPPDTRDARLEAVSLFNAAFFVEVTDRRNLLDEEADPVGGEGFEYELTVSALDREVAARELPVSEVGELTVRGETDWYELTAPGRVRLELSAIEQTEGVEPFVYLTYQDDRFVRRGSRAFHHLNNVERVYRVGVVDRRAGGGDDYDYDLSISAETYEVVAEVEPNDGPPEGGQLLEGLPVWVDGTVSGTNKDDYDGDVYVVTLEAGDRIIAETFAGIDLDTDNADTVLRMDGPGFEAPIEDLNGGYSSFSQLADVDITESGAFEIEVRPTCDEDGCAGGDYALAIWQVPAD